MRDAVLIAERKLLVDGGWRMDAEEEGGRFDPWCRRPNGLDPGMDKTEPKVGVVARCMSSGGGGEDGRGGAISCDEVEIVVCLFSGMNWGAGMNSKSCHMSCSSSTVCFEYIPDACTIDSFGKR